MLTRKLWRVLNDPPTLHPLFWATIYRTGATQFANPDPRRGMMLERFIMFYVVVCIGVWFLEVVAEHNTQLILLNVLLVLLAAPSLLVMIVIMRFTLLNGTVHGLIWAVRISNGVAEEREQGRYELLWLSPPGAMGAAMAVCTGCLYRRATFHNYLLQCRMILTVIIFLGVLAVLGIDPQSAAFYSSAKLISLVYIVTFVAGLYIDSIHSTVLGSLVGMLVPTFTHTRLDARVGAALFFLLLQIMTFMLAVLTDVVLLPGLYRTLHITGWFAELSPPLVSLVVFYAVREAMIAAVWHMLTQQLNADPHEWRFWP